MQVASFADIEKEFHARIARIVWCSMATVDGKGRPRQRLIHPIWESSTGWIATGRHSFKEKHLARVPYASFSYWDQQHQQVYVDAKCEWMDDPAEKRRIWDLYKSTPPPLGYDPQIIWQNGVEDPGYGLLKLMPTRIEMFSLQDMITGKEPQVWRPG
jgi:general stress protein 26